MASSATRVSERTNEIRVRMALGAHRQQVLRLVVGQGMRLALAGGLLGLAASILFSRWFGSQLFTVSPFDPLTFVAVAAVLILAALLASYIPDARAARVDPANALRYATRWRLGGTASLAFGQRLRYH